MRMVRSLFSASLLLCVMSASPASGDVIIDDFSSVDDPTPWPVLVNTITSVFVYEEDLTHVIGGSRYSTVRATFLETPGLDFVQAAIVPNFGMVLDYSSTAGARGDWNLLYDSEGSGLDADFTAITDIVIDFARFDFANGQPLPVVVALADTQDVAFLSRSLITSGAQSLVFHVADFAGIGDIDLANVQSLSVFLDPGVAVDFRLSRIYGIPTPGSVVLLGLGAVTLTARRRTRLLGS